MILTFSHSELDSESHMINDQILKQVQDDPPIYSLSESRQN